MTLPAQSNYATRFSLSLGVLSILVIIARRVLGATAVLDYLAILALFALAVAAIDLLLSALLRPRRYFNKQFYIGLAFGLISGLVGGLLYMSDYGVPSGVPQEQLASSANRLARLTRVLVVAAFTNGFLQLAEQLFLLRHSLGHRRQEGLAVLLLAVAGLVVTTFVAAAAPDWIGRPVDWATGHLVDWIGIGTCGPWPGGFTLGEPDKCSLGILLTYQIITIVGVSALLTVAYYAWVLSLSPPRLVLAIGGLLLVLVATYALLYFSGAHDKLLPLGNPAITAALTAMWVGYVAALVQILTWSRQMALNEAIVDAFGSKEEFGAMLAARLGRRLSEFSSSSNLEDIVDAVVDDAKQKNWLEALIVNSRYSRPDHQGLAAVADGAGVGVAPPDPANVDKVARALRIEGATPEIKFQRIVRAGAGLTPPSAWDAAKAKLERCVCRVEEDGSPLGTGFLVAPDLVLTNHHVVETFIQTGKWGAVQCRFDFKGEVSLGVTFDLVKEPCVAFSPSSAWDVDPNAAGPGANELDFALLRLAQPAGQRPLGKDAEANAPLRGHIDLSQANPKAQYENEIVLLLQHPQGGPLKQDIGLVTAVIKDGIRIRHTANTLEGSSGSPCFVIQDLAPIAIHHLGAGWPSQPGSLYNQAVSLKLIYATIAKHI